MQQLTNPQTGLRSGHWASWRLALPMWIVLVVWILFLYRDTGMAMVTIWYRSETFTHGFIVPPIAMWLAWRQRHVLSALVPQPSFAPLLLVAGTAVVWFLGEMVAINSVTQLSLVALLVLTVPAVLGWPVTRVVMFPLGFLFFSVPIGEFLMPQLMEWTANFTVIALRLSGVPVYREGLQFVIPTGNWSVVEACSGVRYLIASLTVGTLFAYLNYQTTKRRILFILVSIIVPVAANWLRAYIIVMLGHFSGNKLAVGVDHLIYGWLFFGFVIMLMFIIGARWAEPEPSLGQGVPKAGVSVDSAVSIQGKVWVATLSCAALLAAPQIAIWTMNRSDTVGTVALVGPTSLNAGWQVGESISPGFKPAFQNPTAEINTTYTNKGASVGLYLGYYQHQNYERKLISSENVLVVSKDPKWAQVSTGSGEFSVNGTAQRARTAELRGTAVADQSTGSRLAVWQIYWINGTLTTNDYLAKVYSAFYRLLGRGDDSAVIIVYTPKGPSGGADRLLEKFLSANYPDVQALLLAASTRKQ